MLHLLDAQNFILNEIEAKEYSVSYEEVLGLPVMKIVCRAYSMPESVRNYILDVTGLRVIYVDLKDGVADIRFSKVKNANLV